MGRGSVTRLVASDSWGVLDQRRLGEASGHVSKVTAARLDMLFHHCADLGIDVEWRDLGEVRHGQFEADRNAIVLNSRMTERQATATLAHELGHQAFGDTCSSPANERRAWQYAAALLVGPFEYHGAETLVGHEPGALAAELGVTVKVVHSWREWWATRGRGAVDRSTPNLQQGGCHQ